MYKILNHKTFKIREVETIEELNKFMQENCSRIIEDVEFVNYNKAIKYIKNNFGNDEQKDNAIVVNRNNDKSIISDIYEVVDCSNLAYESEKKHFEVDKFITSLKNIYNSNINIKKISMSHNIMIEFNNSIIEMIFFRKEDFKICKLDVVYRKNEELYKMSLLCNYEKNESDLYENDSKLINIIKYDLNYDEIVKKVVNEIEMFRKTNIK